MKKRRFLVWATRGLSALAICSFITSAVFLGLTPSPVLACARCSNWGNIDVPDNAHTIPDTEQGNSDRWTCACDAGFSYDGAGHCVATPTCGDGSVNQPSEQCDGTANCTACLCDTGYHPDGGICVADPTPTCGDGSVNQPSEQCDSSANCTACHCDHGYQAEGGVCVEKKITICHVPTDHNPDHYLTILISVNAWENGSNEGHADGAHGGDYEGACVVPPPTCGDGFINQPSEVCDPPADGIGGCTSGCQLCGTNEQVVSGACQCQSGFHRDAAGACVANFCGDGSVNTATEACDPPEDGIGGCTSGCQLCGTNEQVVSGACQCQSGFHRDAAGACVADWCGDGILNGTEVCDGGLGCSAACTCTNHYAPTDPLSTACVYVPYCGDGLLNEGIGEECDPPTDGADGCTSACLLCGDNEVVTNGVCTCAPGYLEVDNECVSYSPCGLDEPVTCSDSTLHWTLNNPNTFSVDVTVGGDASGSATIPAGGSATFDSADGPTTRTFTWSSVVGNGSSSSSVDCTPGDLDMCLNIDGIQTQVPVGYVRYDGLCVPGGEPPIPVTGAGGPTTPLIIPVTGVDFALTYALAQQVAFNLGLVCSGLAMISAGLAKKSKDEE